MLGLAIVPSSALFLISEATEKASSLNNSNNLVSCKCKVKINASCYILKLITNLFKIIMRSTLLLHHFSSSEVKRDSSVQSRLVFFSVQLLLLLMKSFPIGKEIDDLIHKIIMLKNERNTSVEESAIY